VLAGSSVPRVVADNLQQSRGRHHQYCIWFVQCLHRLLHPRYSGQPNQEIKHPIEAEDWRLVYLFNWFHVRDSIPLLMAWCIRLIPSSDSACSMSIVRLGIVAKNFGSTDGLWTAATVARYRYDTQWRQLIKVVLTDASAVEMKLAIICSCVVHLPAFFKQSKTSLSSTYITITRRGGGSSNNDLPEKPSNYSLRNNAILVKSAPRGIIERELADLDTFESR
jgi:hypothetical protein